MLTQAVLTKHCMKIIKFREFKSERNLRSCDFCALKEMREENWWYREFCSNIDLKIELADYE